MKKQEFQKLQAALEKFLHDPLGFVYFAYPWGKKGTLLANETGPDEWQKGVLNDIGQLTFCQSHFKRYAWKDNDMEIGNVIPYAIKAGRDPGKTALISWIIHWFATTRPYCRGIVTANTKVQLETTTWTELAKWWQLSIIRDLFDHNASKFFNKEKENYKTWFITPVVWSKENPQAAAGTHADYVLVIFDEASTIDDIIWETIEAGLTDPYVLWLVAGNPTENTGRFKECWGEFKHRWITRTIDSRDAKRPNKTKIQEWVDDLGEDHDFIRVWVRGEFPKASVKQYIPENIVDDAIKRLHYPGIYQNQEIVMGMDVAREGDDRNVIAVRQGLELLDVFRVEGKIENTMILVDYAIAKIEQWNPCALFIDYAMGFAIVDRLVQLGYDNVIAVKFGVKASQEASYANKRAEMWAKAKEWLIDGGSIPNDKYLKQGLISVQHGTDKKGRLILERKKDIKMRMQKAGGLDEADALALTFAYPVYADDFVLRRTEAQLLMDEVEGRRSNASRYIEFQE